MSLQHGDCIPSTTQVNSGCPPDEGSPLLIVPSSPASTSHPTGSFYDWGSCLRQSPCRNRTSLMCAGLCTILWLSSLVFVSLPDDDPHPSPTPEMSFGPFWKTLYSSPKQDLNPNTPSDNNSVMINNPQQQQQQHGGNCDDILLGVWIETCFLASYYDTFPGPQGILSHPVIITAAGTPARGFNLHAFCQHESFFGGADYLEIGHGQPSHALAPTPNQNCFSELSKQLLLLPDTWSEEEGLFYWNWKSADEIVVGDGKRSTCFLRRIHGESCKAIRKTAIELFARVNILLDEVFPSEEQLCSSSKDSVK